MSWLCVECRSQSRGYVLGVSIGHLLSLNVVAIVLNVVANVVAMFLFCMCLLNVVANVLNVVANVVAMFLL